VIRKTKTGYKVVGKKSRNLGEYKSKKQAARRLRQVEYFKRKKK